MTRWKAGEEIARQAEPPSEGVEPPRGCSPLVSCNHIDIPSICEERHGLLEAVDSSTLVQLLHEAVVMHPGLLLIRQGDTTDIQAVACVQCRWCGAGDRSRSPSFRDRATVSDRSLASSRDEALPVADYMVVATTSYLRLYPTESLQACTAVYRSPDISNARTKLRERRTASADLSLRAIGAAGAPCDIFESSLPLLQAPLIHCTAL